MSMCIVPLGTSQEISVPGTSSTPTSAARLPAASNPSIRSWSVNATALQPFAAASSGIRSGGSDPSDAVECVWRSIIVGRKLIARLSCYRHRPAPSSAGIVVSEQVDEEPVVSPVRFDTRCQQDDCGADCDEHGAVPGFELPEYRQMKQVDDASCGVEVEP